MKTILFFVIFVCSFMGIYGQTVNPNYDASLAKSLGADEYGMKQYVMVILKTGSNRLEKGAKRDSLFAGHMKNISRLVALKKLIVAGPFISANNSYRGIFILDVSTLEEANKILETDPTIREKVLEPELYLWYGSAALPEYLKTADQLWLNKP